MFLLLWILGATFLVSLLGFTGIITLTIKKELFEKILFILVAFSAGVLLSGAFFHLISESFEFFDSFTVFVIVFFGFSLFFLIEKLLHWHHCHKNEKCKVHSVSFLLLIGDVIHNIIDGLIIAASFLVSIPLGLLTTFLVVVHEIPQELGDFGVLVYSGFDKTKALFYNFFSQLTCMLGGLLGFFFFAFISGLTNYLLPFTAGGFIYIAASDLMPELHKEVNLKKSFIAFIFFLGGIVLMASLKILFNESI